MSRAAEILRVYKKIAVVGLSADPARTSYQVTRYMQDAGYQIVGVNPGEAEILGETCFPSLMDVSGDLEIVNVFRRSEFVADIVEQAITRKAKVLWLQLGISDPTAEKRAQEAGLEVISNRCIKVEHAGL